jgi:hypothetical protein
MRKNIIINKTSNLNESTLLQMLSDFEHRGELIGTGYRNVIKTLDFQSKTYNIKSFKVPNIINKIVYNFIRESKAARSYNYALKLLSQGILTPMPVAYVEYKSFLFFGKSYYVSEHLEYDFTIRKLIREPMCDDYDRILREFTRFTFRLHENNIHFLDHSPGNTLIKKLNGDYAFYLVDLNRMNFEKLSMDERFKNFARLSPKDYMLDVISDEYASLVNLPKDFVKERMYFFSQQFSTKFKKKEAFKKKYFFWRKKR